MKLAQISCLSLLFSIPAFAQSISTAPSQPEVLGTSMTSSAQPPSATNFAAPPTVQIAQVNTRIVIHLETQTAELYQNEALIATAPVSTGRKPGTTPKGNFTIIEKDVDWTSTEFHVPMPYFMRLSTDSESIGLHAGQLPGYPASHGCIRMHLADAKLFFSTCQRGTPVVIDD